MTQVDSNKLEKDIRTIVAEIIETDESRITPTANFVEDLGMDSMMALEILASVEKKYRLKIPEDNLTKITSLKHVVNLVVDLQK